MENKQQLPPNKMPSSLSSTPPQTQKVFSASKILLWMVFALLLTFFIIGAIFIYQQSKTSNKPSRTPVKTPSQTPAPTAQEEESLTVPTVSEDTTLETIEQELNQLNIASPDSELKELDSEAEKL